MDNPLISELQHLIVESLALEDVQPEDIDPDEPLFGEGLGLDSIDALELGLALKKRFGVTLTAESEESKTFARLLTILNPIANRPDSLP